MQVFLFIFYKKDHLARKASNLSLQVLHSSVQFRMYKCLLAL